MKEKSAHKNTVFTYAEYPVCIGWGCSLRGFNTLEIIIALALMLVVIVGALNANIASQYWTITSQTSNEALYKAKTLIEEQRAMAGADFQSASSTVRVRGEDPSNPIDASCVSGGLCYFMQKNVFDISSCSKYAEGFVEWKVGARYPTSTESLYTNLTSNGELIAVGGDCALTVPEGDWLTANPATVGELTFSGTFATGIDVLQGKIYLVSSTSPQLRIFDEPAGVGDNPVAQGSSSGNNLRLNSIDVMRDLSTGRRYAFVAQHATTSQIAVFDVTDASNPAFVRDRTLYNVDNTGSFPEGWRVFVYGGRLYAFTRETTGPEFHIFNINSPTQPTEINGAVTELNRTVNDMVVREQMRGGVLHRYLFLSASAGLKELAILDVTGDSVTEVIALDLPGSIDARSIFLNGNKLYVGRASGSGPELFLYDVLKLLDGNTTPERTSEVSADVNTIRAVGDLLFLGTGKSGEEFQVWKSDENSWHTTTPNAGRVSYRNVQRLAPLGIDFHDDWVYLLTQSATQPEVLRVLYTP